jgi:hypothetical protein
MSKLKAEDPDIVFDPSMKIWNFFKKLNLMTLRRTTFRGD